MKKGDSGWRVWAKDAGRVGLVVVVFGFVLFLLEHEDIRRHVLDIEAMRADVQAEGEPLRALLSRLAFVGLAALLVGLGLPRLYVSTVAGALFGLGEGVCLALVASLAGSSVTYKLGRSLLAGTVRRRLGARLLAYRDEARKDAFWWVLYGRLVPFANATLLNLTCGACRVPMRAFLLASAVGFLPLTIAFASFGSGGAKGDWSQISIGGACLMVAIPLQRVARRLKRRRQAQGAAAAAPQR